MNTLNGQANLSKDPHFETRVTKLLTLQVRHFESEGSHQVVVQQGGGGCGEVRGHQAGERSSFHAEDVFFFIVSIFVHHCWFIVKVFHFRLYDSSNFNLGISLSDQM